jgi:integrase/recombinase XerD
MQASKAVEGFILSKLGDGLSPNTARIYRWCLSKLVTFIGDKDAETITTADLRAWMAYLRNDYQNASQSRKSERLSASSLQDMWTAAKSFCRWCAETLNAPNAADGLKRPEGESPVIVPFSEDEIRALLKMAQTITTQASDRRKTFAMRAPNAKRNTAIILTLLDTGLRLGELCRLQVGDVDLTTGAVQVSPFGSGRKTKARQVYLGKAARRAVWLYLSSRDDLGAGCNADARAPVFITDENRAMTENSVSLFLRGLGARAGIAHVHAHRFRHTFAIQFLRGGGDVFSLQRMLGHSTMEMVRRYLALADADDAEAHRRASPADRWRL